MPLNLIFMGTPNFAVPILKAIQESHHNILEVYTQPPNKKDRGQKISLSAVHKFCHEVNLKVNHPDKLDEEIEKINKLNPDIVLVVAYGKILPKKLLEIKKTKFINIHASLLPRWRGAAPIQRAIMNLDKETGISIMKIEPKLDSGPIMMSSKIKIFKSTNYDNLSNQLSVLGAEMILKSLNLIEKKLEKFIPQNESKATYAKKINKTETKIDWSQKAKIIIAKINGLYPNPGSWFEFNGIRIKPVKAIEIEISGKPGQIIGDKFTIGCSENSVQILELQREGKKKMKAEEFLKGSNLKAGMNILSQNV